VVNTMAGQEGNIAALVGENLDRRRGRTPRCNGIQGSDRLEAFELAKASTANDGDKDGLYRSKEFISIAPGMIRQGRT
jgi:hypothetical protein